MKSELIQSAKNHVASMASGDLKKAYLVLLEQNDKLAAALVVDELQKRNPELYAEMYDEETFEIDTMTFVSRSASN